MQVEDRSGLPERHFIKKGNGHTELLLDEVPMGMAHGDDHISVENQLLGQEPLGMCGWIGAFLDQSMVDDGMDGLRLRDDAG